MTQLSKIERALAEFDASRLGAWEHGTNYRTPEPSMLASPMMLFHPGLASKEKQDILAYFWAVELDDRERSLLSRLPMALAATIVLRVDLEGSSQGNSERNHSLNNPSAVSLRRLARAKGCARVLMSGLSAKDIFEAPPWIDSQAPDLIAAPSASRKASRPLHERVKSFFASASLASRRQASVIMLGAGFSLLLLFMACLAIANPGFPTIGMLALVLPCAAISAARLIRNFLANRAFIEKVFGALPLLAQAYPDLAKQGLFEPPSGLRDGTLTNVRSIPELLLLTPLQEAIEAEKIKHPVSLDVDSQRAGSMLGHVLSEHPGQAWPNERLFALREEIAIGRSALPASSNGKISRL